MRIPILVPVASLALTAFVPPAFGQERMRTSSPRVVNVSPHSGQSPASEYAHAQSQLASSNDSLAPPPETTRYSTPMMVAGIGLTGLGGLGMLAGVTLLVSNTACLDGHDPSRATECSNRNAMGLGTWLAGGVMMAAGIPLIVWAREGSRATTSAHGFQPFDSAPVPRI